MFRALVLEKEGDGAVAHVRELDERALPAGDVTVAVESDQALDVLTVRSTAFDAAGGGGTALLETLAAGPDLALSRVVGRERLGLRRRVHRRGGAERAGDHPGRNRYRSGQYW